MRWCRVALGLTGLALLELALRLRSRGSRDWLDEGLRPGALIRSMDGEERRVVVLGDSIAYGHDLEPEQSYPHLLGKLLAEHTPGQRVRVINAGISGNTVLQGLQRLRRHVLSHEPDVVIVAFGINDEYLNRSALDVWREWDFRLERSPMGRVAGGLNRLHLARATGARLKRAALRGLGWLVPSPLAKPRVGLEAYCRGLQALIAAIPQGTPVLLLTMTSVDWTRFGALYPKLARQQEATYQRYDSLLRDLPHLPRTTLVDVSNALENGRAEAPFLADGIHLSPQGHEAMAQALLMPTLGALGLR